jgi:hypothetical protein
VAVNHFRCDAAEARSYGTNEPHRESTQRVDRRPAGANYIPDATGDQIRLEASIWEALARPYDIPMHPFGIVRTRPFGFKLKRSPKESSEPRADESGA